VLPEGSSEAAAALIPRVKCNLLDGQCIVSQQASRMRTEVAAIVHQVRERRENTAPPRPSGSAELITVDPTQVTTEQHREAGRSTLDISSGSVSVLTAFCTIAACLRRCANWLVRWYSTD